MLGSPFKSQALRAAGLLPFKFIGNKFKALEQIEWKDYFRDPKDFHWTDWLGGGLNLTSGALLFFGGLALSLTGFGIVPSIGLLIAGLLQITSAFSPFLDLEQLPLPFLNEAINDRIGTVLFLTTLGITFAATGIFIVPMFFPPLGLIGGPTIAICLTLAFVFLGAAGALGLNFSGFYNTVIRPFLPASMQGSSAAIPTPQQKSTSTHAALSDKLPNLEGMRETLGGAWETAKGWSPFADNAEDTDDFAINPPSTDASADAPGYY